MDEKWRNHKKRAQEKLRDVEASLEEIRSVKGVRDLRIIGNN